MTVHLIKLAVGIRDVDHLESVQSGRLFSWNGQMVAPAYTRRQPRRDEELTDGGSIYWVIKGAIRCRQRILGFETAVEESGEPYCLLLLDPATVAVEPRPCKPFQGWRYLAPKDVPADLGDRAPGDEMPPEMMAELRALGLL